MDIQERIMLYAEILYKKALEGIEMHRYRDAEISISACGGAAMFLATDDETPENLKKRAIKLVNVAQELLGDLRRIEAAEYGERFMSGSKKSGKAKEKNFFNDIYAAAEETRKMSQS